MLGWWIGGMTSILVAVNFCMAETTQAWLILSVVFSLLFSCVAVWLCLYSLIFTNVRVALVAIAGIAVILSTLTKNLPAMLRFNAAKSQLERIVEDVSGGKEVSTPFWVGTYLVKELEVTKTGELLLWTALHPNGNTGLVFTTSTPKLNIMTKVQLDEHWYLVCVD